MIVTLLLPWLLFSFKTATSNPKILPFSQNSIKNRVILTFDFVPAIEGSNKNDIIAQMRSIVNEHVVSSAIDSSKVFFYAYLVPFVVIPFHNPVDAMTMEHLAMIHNVKFVSFDVMHFFLNNRQYYS
jgi:hypothetical protein